MGECFDGCDRDLANMASVSRKAKAVDCHVH